MNATTDLLSRFGFHTLPFTREIPVKERFALDLYEESLVYLQRALANRMSAALIAPAGTGKTALLRALCERLPETRYRVHYVKVTDVSRRDLCREIAAAVDLAPAGTYPVLVRRLQARFSAALEEQAQRPVLVFDEAHGLRPEVLGLLCTLTDFARQTAAWWSVCCSRGSLPWRRCCARSASPMSPTAWPTARPCVPSHARRAHSISPIAVPLRGARRRPSTARPRRRSTRSPAATCAPPTIWP